MIQDEVLEWTDSLCKAEDTILTFYKQFQSLKKTHGKEVDLFPFYPESMFLFLR